MNLAIEPEEYNRLLGYPRGWVLHERARELADWARSWYAENGRPWVHTRQAESLEIGEDSINIEGAAFRSPRLRKMLEDADANGVFLAAVSAGPELEHEAARLWRDEKPDEYFFLETFGSAVVEHLVTTTGSRFCAWADDHDLAVLPHYSPGYPEWDIREQALLMELLRRGVGDCPLDVLESGALRPKKSLLAVFGVAPKTERLRSVTSLVPCQNCSLKSCDYRRAPVRDLEPKYVVNRKALERWATERLTIEAQDDRSIRARFRYDGTTCTNMGRPLVFHYYVELGPREEGYPIRDQRCTPAGNDEGYKFMCQYLKTPGALMDAIDNERPLFGRPLNNIFSWQRPEGSAACYCDPASRGHKWGLVLETIHYALTQGGR